MTTARPVEVRTLPEPEERTPLTLEHVAAQVLQNCAGGFGIGAAAAILFWWAGVDPAQSWPYSTGAAVICAGVATAIRAWADEWRDVRKRAEWEAAIENAQAQADEMEETNDQLQDVIGERNARIEEMRIEIARLRWANDQLRTESTPNYRSATPAAQPEADDASALLTLRYNTGRHPARATLRGWGWSDARTASAISTLCAAGVLDMADAQHPKWLHADGRSAMSALADYRAQAANGGGANPAATPSSWSPRHAATIPAGEGEQ